MKRDIDFLIISMIIGSATSIVLSITLIPQIGSLGAAWGEVFINVCSIIWLKTLKDNMR